MTQVLFAVFQEEMGGSELQGVVKTSQAAEAWVRQLQHVYQMTHRDPIAEAPGRFRRWNAMYASWEIREVPVLEAAPAIEVPAGIQLAVRLLGQVNPRATIADLPPEMQETVQVDVAAVGSEALVFGHDEEVGWFVLYVDPDLFYVVEVERQIGVDPS